MATSTVTVTLNSYPTGVANVVGGILISGTLAFGAGDYVTNGLPVTLQESVAGARQNVTPPFAAIESPSSGYVYRWDPGHGTVRIFIGGAAVSDPLAELANGTALPAGVTGDTVYFTALAVKG